MTEATNAPLRVVLVDDHRVVRSGLKSMLTAAPDIEVVGEAGDGQSAIELVAEISPDVVLMDLSMPGLGGSEATRRILETQPEVKVIILTSFSERSHVLGAIEAGATGYLLKDSDPEQLIQGIKSAASGEVPIDPRVAGALLPLRSAQPGEKLSVREREVLLLVVEGLTNKQIARRLAISEKTVKAHLTNVFRTIGADDRTQAALWADRNGLRAQ